MCGTDWRGYERLYEGNMSYISLDRDVEVGYDLYMQLFQILNVSFWPFFIITKIIILLIFIIAIERYAATNTVFFVWTFFLAIAGFYLWIDNPMRNLIAIAIFYLAMPALQKRNLVIYLLWTALACMFHATAIIMFFFYLIINLKFKYYQIIILIVLANILFSDINIIFFVGKQFHLISKLIDKIELYELLYDKPPGLFSIGFIMHNIIFFLILLQKNKFYKLKNGVMLFNFSFLFVVMYRLSLTFIVANRFFYMITPLYAISIFMLFKIIYHNKLYKQLLLVTGVLMFTLFSTYNKVTGDYRYIPYTNYLSYIFREKPSAFYRDRYNKIYSPYENKEME
jgi:hypothetical protein